MKQILGGLLNKFMAIVVNSMSKENWLTTTIIYVAPILGLLLLLWTNGIIS